MSPRTEVCFLVGFDGSVLWSDRSGSPSRMPDSRERWEAIWVHREEIAVIAHSHPNGPAAFSAEDQSTMTAIDAALGRELRYAVVTVDAVTYRGPGADPAADPEWAA